MRELNEEFDELEEDVINSPSEEEPDCSDDEELDDKQICTMTKATVKKSNKLDKIKQRNLQQLKRIQSQNSKLENLQMQNKQNNRLKRRLNQLSV